MSIFFINSEILIIVLIKEVPLLWKIKKRKITRTIIIIITTITEIITITTITSFKKASEFFHFTCFFTIYAVSSL